MFKRASCCLLAYLILMQPLLGIWRGRSVEVEKLENIWIYANDQGIRTLSFIAFENISQDKAFESFSRSIPKAIAEGLQPVTTLRLASNDYIPKLNHETYYNLYRHKIAELAADFSYEKFLAGEYAAASPTDEAEAAEATTAPAPAATVPSSDTEALKGPIAESLDAASAQQKAGTEAEQTDAAKLSPQELLLERLRSPQFAYLLHDEATAEYVSYQFIKKPSQYIDAQLAAAEVLEESTIPIITNAQGLRVFTIDSYAEKQFRVQNKLYSLNGLSLLSAVKQIPSDYILYGTYETKGINITVSLYFIYKHEKKIVHFFQETYKGYNIGKELKTLATHVVGFLEQRAVVENIKFTANTPPASDTLFVLDGKVVGRIPLTLARLVERDYSFAVVKPGYRLKAVRSQLPLTVTTFFPTDKDAAAAAQSQTEPAGTQAVDAKTLYLEFEPIATLGSMSLNVTNDMPVSFYINEELKAVKATSYTAAKLLPGQYYVSVDSTKYEYTRTFQLEVFPNKRTHFSMSVLPAASSRKVNYNLGARISAAFGLTLLGAFFFSRLETVDMEDKLQGIVRQLEEGTSDDTGLREYEARLRSDISTSEVVDISLLSASLISLITMTIMHTLDVRMDRAPIETRISHRGDVQIYYQNEVSF